jgi:hypothetical protein
MIEKNEVYKAVANAKPVEYRAQARRLALLVHQCVITKAEAIDVLWDVAIAHGFDQALGEDRVQAILAEPFAAMGLLGKALDLLSIDGNELRGKSE